jgi:hypothetical protein
MGNRELISAPAHDSLIPSEHWYEPPDIDEMRKPDETDMSGW